MLVSSFSISACFYIFSISGILGSIYLYLEFNPDKISINEKENTELVILNKSWLIITIYLCLFCL